MTADLPEAAVEAAARAGWAVSRWWRSEDTFPEGEVGDEHRAVIRAALAAALPLLATVQPDREGVGTGAGGETDPAPAEATSLGEPLTDCPEAPAQAHPLPAPSVEDARAEAERRWPQADLHIRDAWSLAAFVAGAEWARSTTPARVQPDRDTITDDGLIDLYWRTTGDDWAIPDDVMVGYGRAVLALRPGRTEAQAWASFPLADVLNLRGVLIPGTPVFGCPICGDPWESEPSCEHAKAVARVKAGFERGAHEAADQITKAIGAVHVARGEQP